MTNPVQARRILMSGTAGRLPYDPFLVSGLSIWHPTGDFVPNGSTSGRWFDRSGNGWDATEGTGANQPTIVRGAANGKDVLRWSGGTNRLSYSGAALNLTANLAAMTVIAVVKYTGSGSFPPHFYASTGASATATRVAFSRSATQERMVVRTTDAGGATTLVGGTPDTGNFQVITDVINWAGNDLKGYQNGTEVLTGAPPSVANTDNTASLIMRLGNNGNATAHIGGDIATLLVYNRALTAAERQYLERGLGAEFNLSVV